MSLGSIVKIVADYRAQLRQEGASQAVIDEATERIVRANWPQGEREWRYLCQRCGDYGLEMFTCPGDATCGRDKPHLPHEYGQPCWCAAGNKFKKKAPAESDWTEAAKVPKPSRTFTRAGR